MIAKHYYNERKNQWLYTQRCRNLMIIKYTYILIGLVLFNKMWLRPLNIPQILYFEVTFRQTSIFQHDGYGYGLPIFQRPVRSQCLWAVWHWRLTLYTRQAQDIHEIWQARKHTCGWKDCFHANTDATRGGIIIQDNVCGCSDCYEHCHLKYSACWICKACTYWPQWRRNWCYMARSRLISTKQYYSCDIDNTWKSLQMGRR